MCLNALYQRQKVETLQYDLQNSNVKRNVKILTQYIGHSVVLAFV